MTVDTSSTGDAGVGAGAEHLAIAAAVAGRSRGARGAGRRALAPGREEDRLGAQRPCDATRLAGLARRSSSSKKRPISFHTSAPPVNPRQRVRISPTSA